MHVLIFVHVSFPLGLGPRHYTVHLRAVLLLQFMEHLDKLMYNAYEGSCVTLPPVPKVPAHTITRNSIKLPFSLDEWLPVSKLRDWLSTPV